jgi:hypothetical protein
LPADGPVIERFFPGVERTRGSLALAEKAHASGAVLHYAFEPKGLRLRQERVRGMPILELFGGLVSEQRAVGSRQLFLALYDELDGENEVHGAVHPANVVYHSSASPKLVDRALNRCTMYPYGAGPIPAQSTQVDYRVWLWSVSRPSPVEAQDWDLANLMSMCAQLSAGPKDWQTPWTATQRLEAIERWSQSYSESLPQGADSGERLRRSYQSCLTVEACL